MKKILIILLCFMFCFAFISFAERNKTYNSGEARLQYNPFNDKYEFIKPNAVLKYNPFGNTNEYVDPDAKIEYNQFEDEYQYVDPSCGTTSPESSYTNPEANPDYDPY